MIDFKEIDKDGEIWELFSRDFLEELGFYIESSVDRGPDGKKDLIVTEHLSGNLGNYKFKWLVSCKHFANRKTSNSVKEEDEPNILERVQSFNCDGFIGFYSTVPSSGLNTRLTSLKQNGTLKDYRVFDHKMIENYLIRKGFSELLMRYFPISYKKVKPLHLLLSEYVPLHCRVCDKDILEEMYKKRYAGVIVEATKFDYDNNKHHVQDVYWSCKGACDQKMEKYYWDNYELTTAWEDIGDLTMPTFFLRYILTFMNQLKSGEYEYSEEAYKKSKEFIMAVAQKVFREMTEEEKKRTADLINIGFW
jgi:hypothetical protein